MSNISVSDISTSNISTDTSTDTRSSLHFSLIGLIFTGLLGMIGSILVIIIVFKNKQLRTPCFQLIAGGAFGSIILGAFYFGRGIDTLRERIGGSATLERSALVCLLTAGMHGMFAIPYHAIVTFMVCVDRTIGIMAPIKYRTFGNRYVIYILSSVALIVIIQEAIGFITAPLDSMVFCWGFPAGLHPTYISTFAGLNLFYCTLNVTVYITMLICFYIKQHKHKKNTSEYATFMKQQSAAMPTVRMITVLYFITGIIPEIIINVVLRYGWTSWGDFALVFGDFLKCGSSMVEITALMLCSKMFRDSARVLVGMTPSVAPALIVAPPARNGQ